MMHSGYDFVLKLHIIVYACALKQFKGYNLINKLQ